MKHIPITHCHRRNRVRPHLKRQRVRADRRATRILLSLYI